MNASPLTVVISYDSTQTMVTNSTCGVTGVAPLIPTVFNLLKPNESCPTTATNWPFPYTMCACKNQVLSYMLKLKLNLIDMNNYPKNGWLELQDIETNYTVTSSVAAASVSACEQQCLVSNNCYGFVFKNGNCYFNQEGGKVGLGFCNTFQSPGSTYKTIYGSSVVFNKNALYLSTN